MSAIDSAAELRRLERRPVRLVFDSAENPLPAGVRGRDVTSRHLLYESGELSLDLRLDHDPETPLAVVVGQLLARPGLPRPSVGLPVFLVSGDRILKRTASNAHGEFLLNVELGERPLCLCLLTEAASLIEVPVPGACATADRRA